MSSERYDGQSTPGYEPQGGYAGRPTSGNENELRAPVPDQGDGSTVPDTGARHAAQGTGDLAEVSRQGAKDVKDTTLQKAAESKDVIVERGADVVAVAKDEAAELAHEAQAHLRSLWAQASGQLHEQATMAQKQVADLLHSLAGELGEMASKSEQQGPVTSLARQAATRGGALSHWLSTAETGDVLVEVKRFARRRPMAFLAGAAVTGVLVGRLGRGLMADAATDSAVPSRRAVSGPTADAHPASGSVVRDVGTTHLTGTDPVYGSDDSSGYADASSAGPVGQGLQYEGGLR